MSFRRRVGGFIAAWFLGLLVSFAGWMLRRAFKKQEARVAAEAQASSAYRTQRPVTRHTQAPPSYAPVRDTICAGMSEDDLVSTYGRPAQTMRTQPGREVWTYPGSAMANDNVPLTVVLENGHVTDWSESVTSH